MKELKSIYIYFLPADFFGINYQKKKLNIDFWRKKNSTVDLDIFLFFKSTFLIFLISYFYLKIKSRQKFNINALNFFGNFGHLYNVTWEF